jgi:hypothetical protein
LKLASPDANRSQLRPLNDAGVFGKVKTSAQRYPERRLSALGMRPLPQLTGPVPDLAFSQMKFLKTLDANRGKSKVGTGRHPHDSDDLQKDTSKFFPPVKNPGSETKQSIKSTRGVAQRETPKEGRARVVAESISSRGIRQSKGRQILQEDTNASARSSSSYFTWSKSGRQSSRAASHPKAPDSIQTAAFQFKPGPFRSSSVGAVEKSVNSTIQRAQPIKRVCSDGAKYATTLDLSGGSSSNSYQQAVLSSEGAQHGDKKPQSFQKGGKNKKFGPQKDAQFLPHQDSFKPSDFMQPAAGKPCRDSTSYQNHLAVSQLSNDGLIEPHPKSQRELSSSMERLLNDCKLTQRQRTERVAFADRVNIMPPSTVLPYNEPFRFFPQSRGGERVYFYEPHNGSTGEEGFLGAYAEEVGPWDDEEQQLAMIDSWCEQPVDEQQQQEQQEQLLWPHEDERMVGNHGMMMEEMDYGEILAKDGFMEMSNETGPHTNFAIETRREGPSAGFWRPHRLY